MSSQFPVTRWTLVEIVSNKNAVSQTDFDEALETLCEAYRAPLFRFICEMGVPPGDADDLVQSFFVKLLNQESFGNARRDRGKLRDYLLKSLQNHLRNEWRSRKAQKRGGALEILSTEQIAEADVASPPRFRSPSEAFDYQWACSLLAICMRRLEAYYFAKGEKLAFDLVSPFLSEFDSDEFEEACQNLGISRAAGRVRLHRMKKLLNQIFEEEVAATLLDGASLEEEIQYLATVLR